MEDAPLDLGRYLKKEDQTLYTQKDGQQLQTRFCELYKNPRAEIAGTPVDVLGFIDHENGIYALYQLPDTRVVGLPTENVCTARGGALWAANASVFRDLARTFDYHTHLPKSHMKALHEIIQKNQTTS